MLSLIVIKTMLTAKTITSQCLLLTGTMTINRSHQGSCVGHSKHAFKENSIVKRRAFQRIYSNFVEDEDARCSSLCNGKMTAFSHVFLYSTRVSKSASPPNKASICQNSADPTESLKENVDSFRQEFFRI